MNNRSHVRTSEILLGLFPELVFIVLPLSVVVLVDGLYHHKGMLELLGSPEWAFAAVVLWGQASVKFSSGLPARGRLRLDAVGAVHAAILLLGLGPAFVVLILSLVSAPSPTVGLVAIQLLLSVAGIPAFLGFGGLGLHAVRSGRE